FESVLRIWPASPSHDGEQPLSGQRWIWSWSRDQQHWSGVEKLRCRPTDGDRDCPADDLVPITRRTTPPIPPDRRRSIADREGVRPEKTVSTYRESGHGGRLELLRDR